MADERVIARLGFASANSHVNEPRGGWRDNLPPKLHSEAVMGITAGDEGKWSVLLAGETVDQSVALRVGTPARR